jgi:signal transduction histidine kinase
MDYYTSAKGKQADRINLSYVKKGSNGVAAPETDLFAYLEKQIVLDPGYLFMGLKFSGGLASRQHNFLFRITEIDTLWHKSNLDNEISFYGLAPGTYTLQARFPSVSDSRYWFTKTIVVVPHFYQSLLFKLIMALLIALAVYSAWLYRISKIRGEHLLRTTIASDLHDEIGSALTRISFSSELMNIKQKLDSKVVERISADSKGAIASISDIIWSVDARNDTTDDLLLRIREHAGNMLENAAALHIDAHGLDRVTNLPQLMRQNIYLVFKEAINNIARHNVSPEVWISLDNQPGGMVITIKNTIDIGKEKSTYTGQGLRNMQMRAKRIKALLDVNSDGRVFSIVIKMRKW